MDCIGVRDGIEMPAALGHVVADRVDVDAWALRAESDDGCGRVAEHEKLRDGFHPDSDGLGGADDGTTRLEVASALKVNRSSPSSPV